MENTIRRLWRLAIIGAFVAGVTIYFWMPFFLNMDYLAIGVYLPKWKFDSYGADQTIKWLVNGELLDHGRWPVMTLLLAVGIVYAIRETRRGQHGK